MSKAQTTEQLIEEAVSRLEEKLKPLYKSGSFDVFNLKVAIEKELTTIASKSAEAERKRSADIVKEAFENGIVTSSSGNLTIAEKLSELIEAGNEKKYYSMNQIIEALSKGTK